MIRIAIGVVAMPCLVGAAFIVRAAPAPATQSSTQAASAEVSLTPAQMAQAQFNLGVRLMGDGKFAGAAQAFGRATTAQTNFPEAYNNWGISLVQIGKQAFNTQQQLQSYQAAAEKFSTATSQKPGEKSTYMLWSETLLLIGDMPVDSRTRLSCYQGAVDKCRKATELAPNDWDSYNKWAVILSTKLPQYAVGDQARVALYKEAAALYAKAADRARFSGDVGPIYANWASVLVQAARITTDRDAKLSLLREALGKFDQAAKVHPGVAGTYAMWGSALIDLGKASHSHGDYRDAVDKLRTSLALRANEPGTLYDLACVYGLLDEPVLVMENLKKCFDADHSQVYRQSAAQNPDLASLHGNPDFDELVGLSVSRNLPTYNPPLTDTPR